jgi:hypothetical protein
MKMASEEEGLTEVELILAQTQKKDLWQKLMQSVDNNWLPLLAAAQSSCCYSSTALAIVSYLGQVDSALTGGRMSHELKIAFPPRFIVVNIPLCGDECCCKIWLSPEGIFCTAASGHAWELRDILYYKHSTGKNGYVHCLLFVARSTLLNY